MDYLGHYINGAFEFSKKKKLEDPQKIFFRSKESFFKTNPLYKAHISPSDFNDEIFRWPKNISCPIDDVFEKGKKVYLPWTKLSQKDRVKKLLPLKKIIKKETSALAKIISRETGKPLWESEGEINALIGKIDFVLGEGLKRIKEKRVPQAQGRIRFKSRGLFVVIGPFNFPLHLPFGQILPALVSGNIVIFKPSEKTPASGQKLAECFHRLKLPPGVFQMVQGGAEISEKLCRHQKGDGIFFTGSYKVGQKIKESLIKDYSKILALEMGGYNSTLIWDYKDKKQAVAETLKGCFWTAGQRCSSTSQIILHKSISSEFIEDFVCSAKKIQVDHWSKNPFMGALIDSSSVRRFFSFQEEIKKQGGKILLEGKKLKNKKGYYVTPGIYKMKFDKSSTIGTKETFTPQVLIYETKSLDKVLEMINHSSYGLVLSLWTEDKKVKEKIFYQAKVGLINYNLSSIGASGSLPFGGLGKSGNNRPAGAFAIDSCVTPLAEKSRDGF